MAGEIHPIPTLPIKKANNQLLFQAFYHMFGNEYHPE